MFENFKLFNPLAKGFFTSEFFMAAAGVAAGLALAAGLVSPEEHTAFLKDAEVLLRTVETAFGAMLSLGSIIGYAVVRGQVKTSALRNGTDPVTVLRMKPTDMPNTQPTLTDPTPEYTVQ